MPFENDAMYLQNIDNINHLTSKILFGANALCPLFIILTHFGIFNITLKFSLLTEAVVLFFTLIQTVLVFILHRHRIPMYFGLIGMNLIIAFLGTNSHVGIYISFSLMTFLSCLYYNVRVTRFMTLFAYVCMIVSVYFRGISMVATGRETSAMHYTIAVGVGFTIEFFFVYLMSVSITKHYAQALTKAVDRAEQLYITQLETMNFIPKVLESHEVFTGHHVRHTVRYVEMICRELVKQGHYKDILDELTIETYAAAANLHDIGKIHIPDHILNKRGKYTAEEFQMMKKHPEEGKKLIESLPNFNYGNFNEVALQMAYCHHEKFDGSGYPRRIKGYDIPLCARIMAAADVMDALISWRPYKEPFTIEKSISIISESKGSHFEPCIADAVIAIKDDIENVASQFRNFEIEEEKSDYDWRTQLTNSTDSN